MRVKCKFKCLCGHRIVCEGGRCRSVSPCCLPPLWPCSKRVARWTVGSKLVISVTKPSSDRILTMIGSISITTFGWVFFHLPNRFLVSPTCYFENSFWSTTCFSCPGNISTLIGSFLCPSCFAIRRLNRFPLFLVVLPSHVMFFSRSPRTTLLRHLAVVSLSCAFPIFTARWIRAAYRSGSESRDLAHANDDSLLNS